MGASNDARELEAWIKAGTGDDKTDILVIADFYDRAAIYSRDRDISRNAWAIPWGGFDPRSTSEPGHIGGQCRLALDPALVLQRELAAASLSSKRGNFSIL